MNAQPVKKKRIGERLLELLLSTNGLPGWVCVGHREPQAELRVTIETEAGSVDITGNHAIVALKPLAIAVGAKTSDAGVLNGIHAQLVIRERREGEKVLGDVKLRLSRSLPVNGARICLFHTSGGRNFCAPALRRETTYLHERWKMWRTKDPRNLQMIPSELFSMWILHHVPRPVFLVSYGNLAQCNMFPMDLLGPLSIGAYVLGMHATSPAIPIWRSSGQIAISAVPLVHKPLIYSMGNNHRQALLDPSSLPVPYGASKSFQIPVPADALSVRELTVERSLDLGSHVLFVARTHSLEARAEAPQMCHIHRFYQQFLIRQNRPLPSL
ncbi:MAG TPA: hypothetical protein VHU83_18645 [Bryobacteraceae bacterium]|jgi:flavin reductase (DIM6/NTAB) family NADH-FMN oxidoreductase RutF|nr:hypothetical protein [Bryobacteraceae bacterium]